MAGFFVVSEHMIYRHNVLPLVVAIVFLIVLYFIMSTHSAFRNLIMPWGVFQLSHDAQVQRVLGTATQKNQSYMNIYKWTVNKN